MESPAPGQSDPAGAHAAARSAPPRASHAGLGPAIESDLIAPQRTVAEYSALARSTGFEGHGKSPGSVGIGEGDQDWPSSLAEIGYDGWARAEVGAGGREHLLDVKRRVDAVLRS